MHARQTTADRLAEAAELLCDRVDCLSFSRPVTHVYNPLRYAWDAHESYLRRFGDSRKRLVLIGHVKNVIQQYERDVKSLER